MKSEKSEYYIVCTFFCRPIDACAVIAHSYYISKMMSTGTL